MFTKLDKLIALRNLRPKRKEGFLKVISVFSFLGIMLGVAVLIIVMSVMNGFRTDLTNKILGLNPHIVVEATNGKITKEYELKITNLKKDLKIQRSVNGEGIILSRANTTGVLIKGAHKEDFLKSNISKNLTIGNPKNFSKNTIIVGNELAFDLNLKINDQVNLISTSYITTPIGSVPKQESFKVVGIFNSGFYEFDKKLIFLNLNDTLNFFDRSPENINLDIYLNNPLEANDLKEKIINLDPNKFVYTWSDLNKSFFSALKVERNVMFLILTLIIIVAAFNIISGLTILIKNKTKEIAILKCLGLSNFAIKKIFFLTGFSIGFLATLTGILLGVIFSIYIEEIRLFLSEVLNINIFPSDIYILEKMPSEINLSSLTIIFLFSIIVTALSSLFPAYFITKKNIMNSLKYD